MKATVQESKQAQKNLKKASSRILQSYEVWARLIEEHGTEILRGFVGYHDEQLRGAWQGHRSSRLNRQWRVIYRRTAGDEIEVVEVQRVTAHDYRRKT